MQNDAGEFVDLYCPRKWDLWAKATQHAELTTSPCTGFWTTRPSSASNRIIHAKDHASIQIAIADVDPSTGTITDSSKIYAICGNIRRMGESDDCISRLCKKDGILPRNL